MKIRRILLPLIMLVGAPALWALGPADIANQTVRLNMNNALVARTAMYGQPTSPWYMLGDVTDFVIDFPEKADFTTTTDYSVELSNELQVSYSPDTENNKAYLKVECEDFQVLIDLTYTSNTAGTAAIFWHQAGNTRHFRNISFIVEKDHIASSAVELPEEIISLDPEMWNDGLQAIHSEIENENYRSATDKLYQKRLVSLLPMVMMTHDASFTNPDYKGNTALHYACGLSHVKLVQWLVEHGADLEARTEKGASVDSCVGGKNAVAIKAILKKAREWRDRPYTGPKVDIATARKAAAWLEREFSGIQMENPEYVIPTDDEMVRQNAQIIYRSAKSGNTPTALGMDITELPANLLTGALNGKVSEDMFVGQMLRAMKQRYRCLQVEYRREGLALAMLPHMILSREDDGMPLDGATAVYRAACEGNVELVRWLISNGADRTLRDADGSPATLPDDTPNFAEIQEALNMHD